MLCESSTKTIVYDIFNQQFKRTSFLNQLLTKSFRTLYKFLILNADIRRREEVISDSNVEVFVFSPSEYLRTYLKRDDVTFNIADLYFINTEPNTFENIKIISQQFYNMLTEYVSSMPKDITSTDFHTHLDLLAESIVDIW